MSIESNLYEKSIKILTDLISFKTIRKFTTSIKKMKNLTIPCDSKIDPIVINITADIIEPKTPKPQKAVFKSKVPRLKLLKRYDIVLVGLFVKFFMIYNLSRNNLFVYNFNPGPFKNGASISRGHLGFD